MLEVMTQAISLSELAEGVMIGITIAIVLGIYAWSKRRFARREQINHLRCVVSQGYDSITRESGLDHQGRVIPADMLQCYLFKNIMQDLDDALKYRANSLNFREVHDVKSILIEIDGIFKALDFGTGISQRTPDMEFYETHFFGKFRKLKWLGLRQ